MIFFQSKGLVLGFYQGKEKGEFSLTKASQGVQSSRQGGPKTLQQTPPTNFQMEYT